MILNKNYLMHRSHKYIYRKWKNGRWVYTYDLNGAGRRTSTDVEKDFSKKNGYAFVTNEQTYEKDGKTVYVTEVNVDNFSFLESKKADQPARTNSYQNVKKTPSAPLESVKKQPNFGISYTDDPFSNIGDPIDISD